MTFKSFSEIEDKPRFFIVGLILFSTISIVGLGSREMMIGGILGVLIEFFSKKFQMMIFEDGIDV